MSGPIQEDEITIPSYAVHDEEKICGFFGPYRFLSNFYPARIFYEGMYYPATEHAYQAAKTKEKDARQRFSMFPKRLEQTKDGLKWVPADVLTSGQSKKFARSLLLRSDWEDIKTDVMMAVVFDKFFRHKELRQQLLDTGIRYLEETNSWGDKCWGE